MLTLTKELWQNRFAIRGQIYVNTKTTVITTKLGMLWWVLDPVFLMLTYYFLVKVIFRRGGSKYYLFLLCGLVTYQFFARSISLCTSALVMNKELIKQTSLPMSMYLIVSPLVQAFFCLIGFGVVMLFNPSAVGIHSITVIYPVLVTILVCFSLGLFLSVFEAYIRDTGKMVMYILRFGMYLSPVLYEAEQIAGSPHIPDIAKTLYMMNPLVHVLTAIKDVLFYGRMYDPLPLTIVLLATLLIMQLGLVFFRKASPYVPKML